jgi:hypothetical protein
MFTLLLSAVYCVTTVADYACLKLHNQARIKVGLSPLKWDFQLAREAKQYAARLIADGGILKHSSSGKGENLYFNSRAATCSAGFSAWFAEKPFYSGQGIGTGNFASYGHFTQIMYPSVTSLGCGISKTILVCRYDKIQIYGVKLVRF